MKIKLKEEESNKELVDKIIDGIDTLKIIKQAKLRKGKHNGR